MYKDFLKVDNTAPLYSFILAWLCFVGSYTMLFQLTAPVSISRKEDRLEEEPSEPSLLASYIQAKKDRVCPIIEFVNTTESSND